MAQQLTHEAGHSVDFVFSQQRRLFIGTGDGSLSMYCLSTGKLLKHFKLGPSIAGSTYSCLLDESGATLISITDRWFLLWHVGLGVATLRLPLPEGWQPYRAEGYWHGLVPRFSGQFPGRADSDIELRIDQQQRFSLQALMDQQSRPKWINLFPAQTGLTSALGRLVWSGKHGARLYRSQEGLLKLMTPLASMSPPTSTRLERWKPQHLAIIGAATACAAAAVAVAMTHQKLKSKDQALTVAGKSFLGTMGDLDDHIITPLRKWGPFRLDLRQDWSKVHIDEAAEMLREQLVNGDEEERHRFALAAAFTLQDLGTHWHHQGYFAHRDDQVSDADGRARLYHQLLPELKKHFGTTNDAEVIERLGRHMLAFQSTSPVQSELESQRTTRWVQGTIGFSEHLDFTGTRLGHWKRRMSELLERHLNSDPAKAHALLLASRDAHQGWASPDIPHISFHPGDDAGYKPTQRMLDEIATFKVLASKNRHVLRFTQDHRLDAHRSAKYVYDRLRGSQASLDIINRPGQEEAIIDSVFERSVLDHDPEPSWVPRPYVEVFKQSKVAPAPPQALVDTLARLRSQYIRDNARLAFPRGRGQSPGEAALGVLARYNQLRDLKMPLTPSFNRVIQALDSEVLIWTSAKRVFPGSPVEWEKALTTPSFASPFANGPGHLRRALSAGDTSPPGSGDPSSTHWHPHDYLWPYMQLSLADGCRSLAARAWDHAEPDHVDTLLRAFRHHPRVRGNFKEAVALINTSLAEFDLSMPPWAIHIPEWTLRLVLRTQRGLVVRHHDPSFSQTNSNQTYLWPKVNVRLPVGTYLGQSGVSPELFSAAGSHITLVRQGTGRPRWWQTVSLSDEHEKRSHLSLGVAGLAKSQRVVKRVGLRLSPRESISGDATSLLNVLRRTLLAPFLNEVKQKRHGGVLADVPGVFRPEAMAQHLAWLLNSTHQLGHRLERAHRGFHAARTLGRLSRRWVGTSAPPTTWAQLGQRFGKGASDGGEHFFANRHTAAGSWRLKGKERARAQPWRHALGVGAVARAALAGVGATTDGGVAGAEASALSASAEAHASLLGGVGASSDLVLAQANAHAGPLGISMGLRLGGSVNAGLGGVELQLCGFGLSVGPKMALHLGVISISFDLASLVVLLSLGNLAEEVRIDIREDCDWTTVTALTFADFPAFDLDRALQQHGTPSNLLLHDITAAA